MAINKNSTGYTMLFAVILVVICGAGLAMLATSLKELQQSNVANEKRQFILSAAGYASIDELKEMEKEEVEKIFNDSFTNQVFDKDGKVIEGADAFSIDIVKEYKATKRDIDSRKYPVFHYKNGDVERHIIPMAGNGLWGPIWGFIALGKDMNTVEGVVFDHKSETPGLGSKIADAPFTDMFTNTPKKIMNGDKYVSINVVKGGVKDPEHQVDAIAGATITSNGVGAMLRGGFTPYMKAFGLLK
ncbi:MAG: Na+-transporting NADH:ubiquinone oxidoreductase subunit C [Saprospiraceae bacterium]|jgi:Na+-transporting NADH:ubiquinone oxidoreductase subunit C